MIADLRLDPRADIAISNAVSKMDGLTPPPASSAHVIASMVQHPILLTLGHRDYGLYTLGNGLSLIGFWVQRVAVGWLTWELTGSATWLGIVAFADLFPSVVVGLLGGVAADRVDRVRIILACQTVALLLAGLLGFLTLVDAITVEWVVAITFFGGMAIGFNQPSRLALAPRLVPSEYLATAIALNSMVFNTARFAGPAVAGLVIVWADLGWAFVLNAVSYLPLLLVLTVIRRLNPGIGRERESAVPRKTGAAIVEAMRHAARHPGLGPLLLLNLVFALSVRPVVELFPGFADTIFGGGADTLAMMTSGVGAGAIVGGFLLAGRRPGSGLVTLVLASSTLGLFAVLLFALAPSLWVGLLAVGLFGGAMVASGVGIQTAIQLAVEPGMRGRVLSLHGIIFRSGPALGALAMGAAGDVLGLRAPVVSGCLIALVVIAVLAARRRRIAAAVDPPS